VKMTMRDVPCLMGCLMFGMSMCVVESEGTRQRGRWILEYLCADSSWFDPDDPSSVAPTDALIHVAPVPSAPTSLHVKPLFESYPIAFGEFIVNGARAFVRGPRSFLRWCCILCGGMAPRLVPDRFVTLVSQTIDSSQDISGRFYSSFVHYAYLLSDPRVFYSICIALRVNKPSDWVETSFPPHTNGDIVTHIASSHPDKRKGLAQLWIEFHYSCPQDPLLALDKRTQVERAKQVIDHHHNTCFRPTR
jgi:hypothetical protein